MQTKKKLILALTAVFALNIFLISCIQTVKAASYRRGSYGETVTEIQEKLSQWGYYSGEIDGIYGSGTEDAVRRFQEKNGLTVDGIAGTATLEAMGISDSSSTSQSTDIDLLARLISAEARGEPYSGQVAVGAVVLNRIKHPSFPNSLSGVIYQPGAFSCLDDGQFYEPVAESAYRAARDAINGWDPSGGAIYYYNPDKTSNKWIRTRPVIKRIGNHLFCS